MSFIIAAELAYYYIIPLTSTSHNTVLITLYPRLEPPGILGGCTMVDAEEAPARIGLRPSTFTYSTMSNPYASE